VNHVGHAVSADRLDGEVDILQAEAMGGDFRQLRFP